MIFVELYRWEPQTVDITTPAPLPTSSIPLIRVEFREMIDYRPGFGTKRWAEFVSAQCAGDVVELTTSELARAQSLANSRLS